jgi:hypothetical protein
VSSVVGRASAETAEDPFGPGDPLEVARLVRRALADGGRKASDVVALVLAADPLPEPAAMARFTRRALGPHGGGVPAAIVAVPAGADHEARCRAALAQAASMGRTAGSGIAGSGAGPRAVAIGVALGPAVVASALCVVPSGSPEA